MFFFCMIPLLTKDDDMPNWCWQYAEVSGRDEDIMELINAMRVKDGSTDPEEKYSLNQLYPIPQDLADTISGSLANGDEQDENQRKQAENMIKYGHKDWYDWANAKWDTKWGACDVELDPEDLLNGSLHFKFESAWSPAIGLLRKVSELFPKLVIGVHYTEEAEFFAGWHVFAKGNIIAVGDVATSNPEFETDAFQALPDEERWERISKNGHEVLMEICDGMDADMREWKKVSA